MILVDSRGRLAHRLYATRAGSWSTQTPTVGVMKSRSFVSLGVIAFVAACADSTSPSSARLAPFLQPEASLDRKVVNNEYIVVLRDDVDVASGADRARGKGARVVAEWKHALRGYAVQASPAVVVALRTDPDVMYVEQVQELSVTETQTPVTWGLDRIDERSLPLGVLSGINWVKANAIKPAVANMSLGGGASVTLDNAVASAISAGVAFAVAAGNSGANACNYSPARTPTAITVGATTSTDARASYSNFGSCVDLLAPGSSISSAWRTSNTATNTISGTSMATPYVAGVVALNLQGNAAATPAAVASALIGISTSGVVGNAGTRSPNRLLFANY